MSAILDPKVWFDGLYHIAIVVMDYGPNNTRWTALRRLCERDRRYEGEQDVYWPVVTCLECVAIEQRRQRRDPDYVGFRARSDGTIDVEVT